jgi:hypothetical protein
VAAVLGAVQTAAAANATTDLRSNADNSRILSAHRESRSLIIPAT